MHIELRVGTKAIVMYS